MIKRNLEVYNPAEKYDEESPARTSFGRQRLAEGDARSPAFSRMCGIRTGRPKGEASRTKYNFKYSKIVVLKLKLAFIIFQLFPGAKACPAKLTGYFRAVDLLSLKSKA